MKEDGITARFNREYDQLFRISIALSLVTSLFLMFFVYRSYALNDQSDASTSTPKAERQHIVPQRLRSHLFDDDVMNVMSDDFFLEDMRQMQKRMDAVFEQSFASFRQDPFFTDLQLPSIHGMQDQSFELREEDNQYLAVLGVSNLDDTKLNVEVLNGQLTIHGVQQETIQRQGSRGSVQRSFTRSMSLPDDADPDGLSTSYRDGMLYITIPKSETGFIRTP